MNEEADPVSYEEAFEWIAVIRGMIEHENALINQRMTWMWTLQGLLLTAAGVLWETFDDLFLAVAAAGLLSCISIGYSLARGDRAIRDLLAQAKAYRAEHPAAAGLPPTIGIRTKGLRWLLPQICLSWAFGLLWVVVLWWALAGRGWLPAPGG